MITPRRSRRSLAALLLLAALLPVSAGAQTVARIGDLTTRPGDVPQRLVGYGLVVGLDGTGDRTFGTIGGATPTVRSVINLLRRFNIEVPGEQLRLRNVAAVLVTAEVSPYLHSGGRFEVQVSALGDATSLHGGVLWITPLVQDPNQPPLATAQGAVLVADNDPLHSFYMRRGNSGRITEGGVLEAELPRLVTDSVPRLYLKQPDLGAATQIAAAVNAGFGAGSATVEDPGSVRLKPSGPSGDNLNVFLAAVDTLPVTTTDAARIVISSRDGTLVAGGNVRLGAAVVSHHGLTLEIGGQPRAGAAVAGLVQVNPDATVQDVAAGLHAAGAKPEEMAAIFDALRAAGALRADVVIR